MTSSRVQLRPPSRAQVARHTVLVEINHAVPTDRALRLLVIRLRPRRAPCAQPCRACPAGWAIVTGAVVDVRLLAGCAGSARHAIRPCKHSPRQSRKTTHGGKRREGQSHHAALLGTDRSRWGQYCFHLLADQGCGRQRLATEAWLAKRCLERALSVCRHLTRSAHGTHALPQLRGRFPIGTGQTAVPVLRRLFPVHT